MTEILAERMSPEIEGSFVVLLIGMRINKLWKVHKWFPVANAMRRMLMELAESGDEKGFLGFTRLSTFNMVQYWRSFDDLEAYARSDAAAHWPAWIEFNRKMKASRGDVGIWHETYLIEPGQYEAIYSGMPAFGLGQVARLVPSTGNRKDARQRLAAAEAAPAAGQQAAG